MNKYQLVALAIFAAGLLSFVVGMLNDDVEAGVVLVFPFVVGTGRYAALGMVLFISAFFIYTLGWTHQGMPPEEKRTCQESRLQHKTKVQGSGIILFGPIPIVIGSNWKLAVIGMILAVVIFLLFFLSFFPR